MSVHIEIPYDRINEFCRSWKIVEFALFGSVLRDDFRPDSDVDVVVRFKPEASWSLFDIVTMQDELEAIFGRKVDLVEKEAIKNPFFKRAVFKEMELIYAA